jgi:hypothetical protein
VGSAHPTLASITSFGAFNNIAVGSGSTPVESIIGTRTTPTLGLSEVGLDHDGIPQIIHRPDSLSQGGRTQINPLHIGSSEISLSTQRPVDGGISQIGISKISSAQDRVGEASSEQPSPRQVGQTQVNHFQVSAAEINSSQISIIQLGPKLPIGLISSQINTSEISLTSSITLQQFLSSHNFNLQNTTIPTWTEFLTGTTPFNLKIEITDRPTGQLAEANITHFDLSGRPASGTLTHLFHRRFANDTDANTLARSLVTIGKWWAVPTLRKI